MSPRKPIPKWMAEKVAANSKQAHREQCPRCRAWTIYGLDGYCLMNSRVDVAELSPLDELRAVASGRRTFTAWNVGGGLELYLRDQFALRGSPAGPEGGHTIHAEHECQSSSPAPALEGLEDVELFRAPARPSGRFS